MSGMNGAAARDKGPLEKARISLWYATHTNADSNEVREKLVS